PSHASGVPSIVWESACSSGGPDRRGADRRQPTEVSMAQNTFHIALKVKDLDAAIARYRKLLGIEPAKVRHDYAKFELADPPVILSLNPGGEPGTVAHLGIRYPGTADLATELGRVKAE